MRSLLRLSAICAFSLSLFAANNPFLGTWKLNPEKSKFSKGTEIKEMTITFEAVGDEVKRVATGTTADGNPINQNSTFAWDSKDHSIDEPGMTVAVTIANENTLDATIKHEGKVVSTIRAVTSKNGKNLTSTEKGQDPSGNQVDSVQIFEKQ